MKKTFLFLLMAVFSLSLWAWENQDWITERLWLLEDGRDFLDKSADHIYWNENPQVRFYKIEIPRNAVLYQVRLRNELFYLLYHTEERNKLIPLGSAFGTRVFDVEYRENYTSMDMYREGISYTRRLRIGQQRNSEYPLVGIWGNLPYQEEYRLISPDECLYYMEIDRRIPGWGAVRHGTYLLRQTGDRVFETVSSFSDGRLRLEILPSGFNNSYRILLTTFFDVPAEEGRNDPLLMF